MPAVHEKMHQRAGQQEEERQPPEEMDSMFVRHKSRRNSQEYAERQYEARN